MDVTCCYATQDKFWVTDPDGNEWEFFSTKGGVEKMTTESECCSTQPAMEEIKTSSCCS
jgi:hypothetical protein